MNKATFMERLCRFHVSAETICKYHKIIEQMANAEQLPAKELKERVSQIFFTGYITCGVKLVTANKDINEGDCVLRRIPVMNDANLVNLVQVRHALPVPELKTFSLKKVYTVPSEDGTPHLSIRDVVSQLTEEEAKKVKAFALRLKDEFVECGYLHLVQAYEFQIELFA